MALSLEIIEEIKRKADIVKVISSYIPVIKKGDNYVALCPFHHDSNPSMQINTTKQIFKCFVCGTGGNVFGFVQKYEGISFIEALKKVCQICNIEVPSSIKYERKEVRANEEELTALEKLSSYYSYMLKTNEGKPAKDYLTERGLDDEVIKKFKIGYAPIDTTKSIAYLREKENIPVDILDKAGITSQAANGFKDRYRDRVIFPLTDIHGNLVGFSGRKFRGEENEAKYVNSPDSLVFQKSKILYNSDNALPFIKKLKFVYILEGFMDVIALSRAEIPAAVGLMGTALTKEHIDLFKKLKVEIRLSLDGDEPGQFATQRCLGLLRDTGLKVFVVKPLVGAKDADEYLKKFGKDALVKAMNDLELPIIHALNYSLAHDEVSSYEDKEKFLEGYKEYFYSAPKLGREEMINALSNGLKVSPDAISGYLKTICVGKKATDKEPDVIKVTDEEDMDFSRSEIVMSLNSFMLKNVSPKVMQYDGAEKLIRAEGQIISRMVISNKAVSLFEKSLDLFLTKPYQDVYLMIQEYYEDLRDGVNCISEGDFDSLLGLAEDSFKEKKDNLMANKDESGAKSADSEYALVRSVLTRLKDCRYIVKDLDEDFYKKVLYEHFNKRVLLNVIRNAKPGDEEGTADRLLAYENLLKKEQQ